MAFATHSSGDRPVSAFRAGWGRASSWQEAVHQVAETLGDGAPGGLGFVYVSEPFADALDLIVRELIRLTGIPDWTGVGGHGVLGHDQECMGQGAIAVLVAPWTPSQFRFIGPGRRGAPVAPGRIARAPVAIVHGDPRHGRLPDAIVELAQASGAFLIGGLGASERSAMQVAGQPVEQEISGVLLDPAIEVITGLTQGCVAIGPVHRVTGARGSWILELDGRPAYQVLREEMGEVLARQPERVSGYIHAALPRADDDRGDYLVRELLALDPRGDAFAIGTSLRQGDPLMFVKRDVNAAEQDLARLLGDLQSRLQGRPVRGALYYACVARGANLFGPHARETAMIRQALGPVPLAGFFAGGEIFRDRLHTHTAILALFV